MKKILITTGLFGVLAFAGSVNAQSASAPANATAKIVSPIAIAKTSDLQFGSVAPSASAGTVVITTAGARSATGGATLVSDGSAITAAAFHVTGAPNATYAITLPGSATISSAGNNMTVDTFASNPSGTGTLSAGGAQDVSVGATLNVGANQAQGSYTGTFSVTVAYN